MKLQRGRLDTGPGLEIGTPRPVTREDLGLLLDKRPQPPVAQRLRDPHHRLARMIAMGHKLTVAAAMAGYSYNRAVMFNNDPAFVELVAQYRVIVNESFKEEVDEYMQLATSNMVKAERQIAEHLEQADEDGELLPLKSLDMISQGRMDRFGYGKKQTNLNVNVDFAAQLEKARGRSTKVIEGRVEPSSDSIRRRA